LGLYYDIAVGTAPGLGDVVSPVYGSPLLGNYGQMWLSPGLHGFRLHEPPAGKLYWRVRSIDTGLAAGPWTPEQIAFVSKSMAHGWPALQGNADTTGENVHELWFADTTGGAPKAFVTGDGWYTVLPSETMVVAGFQAPWHSGTVAGLTLQVHYTTGAKYDGMKALRWGLAGGALADTTIVPKPGQTNAVATFDLFGAGMKSISQVQSLVVGFSNGSGSGIQREMSVDFLRIEVTLKP
jgi:hypothetical protein